MAYLALIILLSSGIINIYLGALHYRLHQQGKIKTTRRISFKVLRAALNSCESRETRRAILKCLKIYQVNLGLFYVSLFLIAIVMVTAIYENGQHPH
jgi:hypothetical protein